ncbi:hypothetical protein BDR04DRAFT_1110511 [Suillus decipiens]|nr:hypothetical protein BDR04DRAFT_1110511 [Suillus decipiens]
MSSSTRILLCPRTLLWLVLSVVRCPQFVSARPTSEVLRRDGEGSSGNGVSTSIWIPVLIVSVVVAVMTLIGCVRRATQVEVRTGAAARTVNRPAGQAASARSGGRRRPARTPSQISTKSLPAYMLEPGDQELVIFRGPLKDDNDPMQILEEEDDHPETRGTHRILDLESRGTTQVDNSATNLVYNVSGDMPVRRSVDAASVGTSHHSQESRSELLPLHTTQTSTSEDPRGEAPPYFEVVGHDAPHTSPNGPPASETSVDHAPPDRRSRFSLFFNPFGGSRHPPISIYNRVATPDHARNASSLSVVSANSGHERNRSGSSSTLLKALRPHDHSAPMTSPSTISLNSISAPLTHTVIRSEFRAPKGGITPEQIKLITSRNALERFGVPYGPDAVAFSASRSNMAPPPDFDTTISSSSGQANGSPPADFRNPSSTDAPERETTRSPIYNSAAADETGQTNSRSTISGSPPSSSSGAETKSQLPSSSRPLPSGLSRSSSVTSFETAASELSRPTTPATAQPVTPVTARPSVA